MSNIFQAVFNNKPLQEEIPCTRIDIQYLLWHEGDSNSKEKFKTLIFKMLKTISKTLFYNTLVVKYLLIQRKKESDVIKVLMLMTRLSAKPAVTG